MPRAKKTQGPAAETVAQQSSTQSVEQAAQPVTKPSRSESEKESDGLHHAAGTAGTAGTAQPEPLEDFLRRIEGRHLGRDVVATAASHPDATESTWPGTYGGIRLTPGPASVTYSDGTTE